VLGLFLSGLSSGAVYALAALGFILIFNATGAINFAHGELVMLGGYLGVLATGTLGLPPGLALVIVIAVMMAVGVVFYAVGFQPLRGKPFVAVFISTIAIGIILRQGALLIAGPNPYQAAPLRAGTVHVGPTQVSWQSLLVMGVTLLLVVCQALLLNRTSIGQRLRAAAQDPVASTLLGVNVRRMHLITFALAASLAGAGGVLLGPLLYVSPYIGTSLILYVYVAVVIGGFGSLPGAVVGGLLLGILQQFIAAYLSSSFRDAAIFGLLIALLAVRPQGLFGEAVAERA